jgi:hypothetical protein
MLRRAFFVTAAALIAAPALATTIYVNGTIGNDAWTGLCAEWDGGTCGPKLTIQAGIDAAANGDAVEVAPDTYYEAINFHGKALNLHSSTGPEATTIDATDLNTSVVTCASGEGPESTLAGFTIVGGVGTSVEGPTVYLYGGGMYNSASSPTVRNCTFHDNAADVGGGIADRNGAAAVVADCTFYWNWASVSGGGLSNENSQMRVSGCTFSCNSAPFGGAFANYAGGTATVIACTFTGNNADGSGAHGGAVYSNSNSTFMDCTFSGNHAGNTVAVNVSGGALHVQGEMTRLTNCTCSGNFVTGQHASGGCLSTSSWGPTTTTLLNSVVWGNLPDEIDAYPPFAVAASYCDVRGGWWGSSNLDEYPFFLRDSGPGPDGRWGTDDDDYGDLRLAAGSCCIDSGGPRSEPSPIEMDLDGNLRVWDGDGDGVAIVDRGAYEYQSHRCGDLNCDGTVNAFDIDPFVLALTDPPSYSTAFVGCSAMLADTNGDGAVNAFDIDLFVLLLTGG